jgi:non-specific serine/threonine protein kinase
MRSAPLSPTATNWLARRASTCVATELRNAIQAAPDFGPYVDPAVRESTIARLRTYLGEEAFARAWDTGRRLSLERAVSDVLSADPQSLRAESHQPSLRSDDPLTSRERDVVRLLAQGCTNREIAEALVISRGTVRTHVAHVLEKLDLHSRVELAVWAVARGLT